MNLQRARDRVIDAFEALEEITYVDHGGNVDDLAEAITELDALRKQLGQVDSLIKSELLGLCEHGDAITTSAHVLSVKNRPKKTVTDWDLLLPKALARISDERIIDLETGEAERIEDAIARLLPALVPMTGGTKPKVGGLTALGFERDECQDVEWGGLSVSIKPLPQEEVAA